MEFPCWTLWYCSTKFVQRKARWFHFRTCWKIVVRTSYTTSRLKHRTSLHARGALTFSKRSLGDRKPRCSSDSGESRQTGPLRRRSIGELWRAPGLDTISLESPEDRAGLNLWSPGWLPANFCSTNSEWISVTDNSNHDWKVQNKSSVHLKQHLLTLEVMQTVLEQGFGLTGHQSCRDCVVLHGEQRVTSLHKPKPLVHKIPIFTHRHLGERFRRRGIPFHTKQPCDSRCRGHQGSLWARMTNPVSMPSNHSFLHAARLWKSICNNRCLGVRMKCHKFKQISSDLLSNLDLYAPAWFLLCLSMKLRSSSACCFLFCSRQSRWRCQYAFSRAGSTLIARFTSSRDWLIFPSWNHQKQD